MIEITIFTPTYNRAHTLRKLFESLKQQKEHNFEWVIVDDGSTDATKDLVMDLKKESPFPIVYYYKCNEGKHIAINSGARLASGKWFFIVDSDDYLIPDALERITYYCNQVDSDLGFAGVVGLRGKKSGEAWTDWFQKKGKKSFLKEKYIDATFLEYRYKFHISGDRAEVVRTEIIRKYPFPKFEDEKFLVESYLWLTLSKEGYKFRWFNDVIYITEYLDDGLTQNISKHYSNNPIGSMVVANLRLSCSGLPWKEKLISCYHYYQYGLLAGKRNIYLIKKCNSKVCTFVGLPLAILFGKKRSKYESHSH